MKWTLLSLLACSAACGTDTAPREAPAPTYWQDVEPILYTHCVSCHTAGGIGPFPLDEPETAMAYAQPIAVETAARRMPPWPPGGDTPALLHTRALTEAQRDTLQAWADAGAPAGDPDQRQAHEEPELIDIGPTELGFDIGVDYQPDSSLSDDYRCFVAELGATVPRIATGFEVVPGNRATVHHVIVGLFDGADRATLDALDAETPDRAGWPCVGGLVPQGSAAQPIHNLGSWVPGVSAVAYPERTGNPIPAGALAVIQVHYNLLAGSAPDRTRVAVALAPAETSGSLIRLGTLGLIKRNLDIAAGDPASVHAQSATVEQWLALRGRKPFPSGVGYVLGAGGHMHLVGKRFTVTRTQASGDTVLLDIPAWDFHWQGDYQYVTPIQVANTDTLTIRCEYDNSVQNRLAHGLTPNVSVRWGEGTQDEMCLGSLLMTEQLP